jgi:hypothetical protein
MPVRAPTNDENNHRSHLAAARGIVLLACKASRRRMNPPFL